MAKDNRRLELTQVPCRQGCWNLEAGVKVYPKVSPGILLLELELDAYSLHLMFMLLYFFSIFFIFPLIPFLVLTLDGTDSHYLIS